MFEERKKEDPSDTAKRYRFFCDSLKSNEEQFEKIYQSFIEKDCKHSITLKGSIASGWNNACHKTRHVKYR